MRGGRSSSALPGAYWRQWTASAVSNLGDGISFAAMPLLAYSITDDERLLSLTTFAVLVPWLLLALPVGAAVDRYDRRILMVGSNVVRFALFGLVAMGAIGEWLSIWTLLALLLVIGTCEVVFDSSAQAFLPMIVPRRQLQRANGYLFAAEVVAGSLSGLAIGAVLFEVSPGVPFAVNAVSFAVAAVLIVGVRTGRHIEPTSAPAPAFRTGMRWLREVPLLRTLAVMLAVTNLGLMLGQGIFVKYAAVELGVTGAGYGLLLAVAAAGAALGGVLGHVVARRLGTVAAILASYTAFGVAQLVIGTITVTWVVAVAGFALSFAITQWNVVTVTLRQQLIPSDVFGRVNSVYRWIGTGASALGAVAGGVLAYATNLRAPYVVAGVSTLVALALTAVPLLRGIAALSTPAQALETTPAPPSIT